MPECHRWMTALQHRRHVLRWSRVRFCRRPALIEVSEDLLDHHRILGAGNDLDGATIGTVGLDVDFERPLQAPRPGYRGSETGSSASVGWVALRKSERFPLERGPTEMVPLWSRKRFVDPKRNLEPPTPIVTLMGIA